MKRAAFGVLFVTALMSGAMPARADDARCIDASERAITLRRTGKLHDALKQLVICADPSCPREVAEECTRRAPLVDASIPTLVVSATDASGRDLIDVRVTVDAAVVSEKLDGRPLSLDPGPHVVKLQGSGVTLEKTFVLRESEKGRREVFMLAPPVVAPPPPPEEPYWNTQRKLAIVSGGLAVVGIGLGTAFGLVASGKKSSEQDDCSTSACPNRDAAQAEYRSARSSATISTISWVAAGAFLTTGVVLFLTARSGPSTARASIFSPTGLQF